MPSTAAPPRPDHDPAVPTPPSAGAPWHGVAHYENFPVGSWLVPRALRPAVVAIYRFARHADDLADEGDATASVRDAQLSALDRSLIDAAGDPAAAVPPVVAALRAPVSRHRLDWQHFHDLIAAFRQDLVVARYERAADVDDYCARSANPVGRLMLELFGAATPANRIAADAICSALQRINFLQDVAIDRAKDRVYLPLATLREAGVSPQRWYDEIDARRLSAASRHAVAVEAARARAQMLSGVPLVARVPPRLGWELRFIVAGGLRILDRLARADHDPVARRPVIGWRDGPALLGRALGLAPGSAATDTAAPVTAAPASRGDAHTTESRR